MTLAWGLKVQDDFRREVFSICKGFHWAPIRASWLMACMAFETAETFSPRISNAAGSGAVGLIQFMPRTARGMGTTSAKLAGMPAVAQLAYVRKYFQPYAYRIASLSDMYMAILMPGFIGKHDNSVLFYEGGIAYEQNRCLDDNKDGRVTKAEASARVKDKYFKGMSDMYRYDYPSAF